MILASQADFEALRGVIEALGEVSYVGPRGNIHMNKQRHTPLTMYLGQVAEDGSVTVIASFENVDPGDQCPQLAN